MELDIDALQLLPAPEAGLLIKCSYTCDGYTCGGDTCGNGHTCKVTN